MTNNLGINIRRQYESCQSQEELLRRFRQKATSRPEGIDMQSGNDKVFVKFSKSSSMWYSPELTLTIENKQHGALIREVIGPNPATFTMTIFLLTGGLLVLFLALMIALSQISLGMSSQWSFTIAGISAAFSVLFYLFIWSGRYRAKKQISELKDFVEQVIGGN